MVSPDPKIERYREEEVQPTEDRYLKKPPTRDFREVAEQVDEKRYREEERKKTERKASVRRQADSNEKEQANEAPPSIFDLVKNTKHRSDRDQDQQEPQVDFIDEEELALKKKLASATKDQPTRVTANVEFVPEQHDLSSVNPLAGQAAPAPINLNTSLSKTAPVAPVQNLQEIIDRITKEIYALEMNGKSETVVTLKGPLFDQSRLILSEFDTARGQFNITFDNLTQAAKNVIDLNQNALIENLSKKGYMVHIVTTTTTLEAATVDPSQLYQDDSRQNNPDQQQRDRDQGQEEQEG